MICGQGFLQALRIDIGLWNTSGTTDLWDVGLLIMKDMKNA